MKRTVSIFLAIVMVFAFSSTALAASPVPYASDYISVCNSAMEAGSSSGKIDIAFNITARTSCTSLGVSKIVIYKSNGTKVTTITGSTSNGLLKSSGQKHLGTYTYSGTKGTSYYAEVTFIAKNASGSDTRTVTTGTVTAP